VTAEIADFDRDGDLDFVVASGPYGVRDQAAPVNPHYLTIWWNENPDAGDLFSRLK
jgi:hypothetical protein